ISGKARRISNKPTNQRDNFLKGNQIFIYLYCNASVLMYNNKKNNFCSSAFWKILMNGPPDTPYEHGVFELYCEFGPEYPVKPPLMRFFTPVYHCNVNSEGRICHNIFDRNYSSQITMREILDAVFGLLIAPEPSDPLDR
uniref:UBC core domain-containing protein n=1 Tax=Sinocyclocheilus rhinocerous TaxID=307959 RepID=A0A673KGQ0_9TELE